ncbi:MAG: type 1 glutamine amidotransferase, partial [bacterium]|nr:type 1 glutamine amidotransferase [bacterium]
VRHDLPLLGICLGGQMLAKVLGAQVQKNAVPEIGLYKTRLTEAGRGDSIFTGFEDEFEVFHWHNDTFKIPYGAALLAEGDTCRNQAFRMGNAVALQFHLEPRPEEIPIWCDEYADELSTDNKSKEDLIDAFTAQAGQLKDLNFRLLKNFLS